MILNIELPTNSTDTHPKELGGGMIWLATGQTDSLIIGAGQPACCLSACQVMEINHFNKKASSILSSLHHSIQKI